jgi:enamine deaminase RidA (YjgF/YER057c/UK114 family)
MMSITRINPDTLHKNPAFTQVVKITAPSHWVFVGGQNGVNREGRLVGPDLHSQTEQALKNLRAALAAAGATLNNVVKMTIYIVQGQSLQKAFAASQETLGTNLLPPTLSVIVVAGLANPEFLIEIEALAALHSHEAAIEAAQ